MIDKPNYYIGYPKYLLELQKLRSVELNAAFLVPYLQEGMSILDCGCGLGSITLGFAELLRNSKIFGIDTEQSLLDIAKNEAQKKGIGNTHFQLGNILKLPFPDDYFDVVFEHSILLHMPDYKEIAIKEMLRVVKPGGIIAARELDFKTFVLFPNNPIILESLDTRNKMFLDNGIDTRMGTKLRYLYAKAKISDAYFSASSVVVDNSRRLNFASNYFASEFRHSILIDKLIKDGTVSLAKIIEYQNEWLKFPEQEGAYLQYTWSEAVGYKK